MASNTAPNADGRARETATFRTATTGEVLSDGKLIELVRDPENSSLNLLIGGKGKKPKILPQFQHEGRLYVPATLDAAYTNRMQLPTRPGPAGKAKDLFARISEVIQQLAMLDAAIAHLATYFVFCTWFADIFSEPPVLVVTGQRSAARELLRILACFCRRALLIEAVTQRQLAFLPLSFCPTLLIGGSSQSPSRLRPLVVPAAAEFAIPGNRGLVGYLAAKAVYTGTFAPAMSGGGIRFSVTPRQASIKFSDRRIRRAIADEFQPRLLAYRLENYQAVANTKFDIPEFAAGARELGRNLGACIVGDSELQAGVIPLLEAYSEGERDEFASDLLAYVLEALVVCCHQQKPSVYVGEIADKANAILRGRGETITMSAREVGDKLRALGLFPKRLGRAGRGILLTLEVCERIHRMAADYSVRTVVGGDKQFSCCAAETLNRVPV